MLFGLAGAEIRASERIAGRVGCGPCGHCLQGFDVLLRHLDGRCAVATIDGRLRVGNELPVAAFVPGPRMSSPFDMLK